MFSGATSAVNMLLVEVAVEVVGVVDTVVVAWHTDQITFYSACQLAHSPACGSEPTGVRGALA